METRSRRLWHPRTGACGANGLGGMVKRHDRTICGSARGSRRFRGVSHRRSGVAMAPH